MVTNVSAIQAKIQAKVFNETNLSQSIEIQSYTSSDNDWGEPIESFQSQSVTRGMVLDYAKYRRKYDEQGLYNDSSFVLLLPHDEVITTDDKVVFNSNTFTVINIDTIPFGDGFTHLIVFVRQDV